ncbi:acyltransferase [Paraneptunicella aestuarii]|uniref:acyltransferase n=1 Tax=Paraneptunicella aestuarii TaxID=2831148 RepID=UPI001E53E0BE|nr:acyltransferase [Paraneptunicella aestuarii]UAA39247.1 acyltransferase [Paraneptunicella aestuarii]
MVFIIFPLHFLAQLFTLIFWAGLIISLVPFKLLLPFTPIRRALNHFAAFCEGGYGVTSVFFIKLFNRPTWDYKLEGNPDKHHWYLLTSNHISYLDIILILNWAHKHIPAPKFFLKQELFWTPFVGQAAWALEMPFMRRYSKAQIAKKPELKGKDIETTRKYCERYKDTPTTVINFVEGTRFTEGKKILRNSPYQHLLPPRAGGISFAIASMGELFSYTIEVTLQYPENTGHVMLDMLKGKLKHIIMHVKLVPVDKGLIGDYFNDPEFRQRFQETLNQNWEQKDQYIAEILEKRGK